MCLILCIFLYSSFVYHFVDQSQRVIPFLSIHFPLLFQFFSRTANFYAFFFCIITDFHVSCIIHFQILCLFNNLFQIFSALLSGQFSILMRFFLMHFKLLVQILDQFFNFHAHFFQQFQILVPFFGASRVWAIARVDTVAIFLISR